MALSFITIFQNKNQQYQQINQLIKKIDIKI